MHRIQWCLSAYWWDRWSEMKISKTVNYNKRASLQRTTYAIEATVSVALKKTTKLKSEKDFVFLQNVSRIEIWPAILYDSFHRKNLPRTLCRFFKKKYQITKKNILRKTRQCYDGCNELM